MSDPRKLRPFEEEERDLVNEGRRFLVATAFSLASITLIAHPTGAGAMALHTVVFVSLLALMFLVLRARGLWPAVVGTGLLGVVALALFPLKMQPWFAAATPWVVGAMALILVFGVGVHILRMAFAAVRRGILNQHVLLETGAFAGIAGGLIGLSFELPNYPTAAFFAVSVMVTT